MDGEDLKKYKRRLVNRLYYLKRIQGDIRYFSKNYKEDGILLDFLKVKEEYRKCVEENKIFTEKKKKVEKEKKVIDDKVDVVFTIDCD